MPACVRTRVGSEPTAMDGYRYLCAHAPDPKPAQPHLRADKLPAGYESSPACCCKANISGEYLLRMVPTLLHRSHGTWRPASLSLPKDLHVRRPCGEARDLGRRAGPAACAGDPRRLHTHITARRRERAYKPLPFGQTLLALLDADMALIVAQSWVGQWPTLHGLYSSYRPLSSRRHRQKNRPRSSPQPSHRNRLRCRRH